jgi:hypothetical protein
VEVDYAPGAASATHTHANSAFIYAYVISDAIESKVNDRGTRIYRAGESWSESPGNPFDQPQREQDGSRQSCSLSSSSISTTTR